MRRVLAAAGSGVLVLQAAQAGGLQERVPVQLDTVVVVGNAGNAGDVGLSANEGIVTAEQLENRPRLRTGELLEVVPGLIVTQHSGDGKANQYFLRGFNLDHGTDFRTTVDGMPVNLPSHGHGQGYTDLNFVIPELVESVRYQKGVYDVAEGDFATAGAAHLELMHTLPRGFAIGEWGEYGYRRLVIADSLRAGPGELLLGGELSQQDGPWEVPEDTGKRNALLRYHWQQGSDRYTVSGMLYRNAWTATDQIPERAVADGRIDRFGSLADSTGGESHRRSLSFEWKRDGEQQGWQAQAYVVDYRLRLWSNFTYFLDDAVNGDQFEQADDRVYYGGALRYEHHDMLFGRHLHHRAGVELRRDDIDGVGLYRTARRQRLATVREDDVRETAVGAYYGNTVYWTPWLRSVAGLRYDRYDFAVDAGDPRNGGDADDALWSPKLSLVFGPWRRSELFLNAGSGFHSNDARGTTARIDPNSGEGVSPVDALVRGRGAEIGLQTRLLPTLQTALSLWTLGLDSELLYIGDAGTTEASRPSRRRGIEFANYWTPRKGLIVDADIALSRARFRDEDPAGQRIPSAIERTASVGLVLNEGALPLRGLSAGARLRYFGSRPLVEDNSQRSSSSTLLNLRAGYAVTPRVQLALDVFNVFDRAVSDIDYFYESRLADEPEPVEDRHFHPAEPRSVRGSLRVRF